MTGSPVAVLVLGEPGADAGPLLARLGRAPVRLYAPPSGHARREDPTALPDGVEEIAASAGEDAISIARGRVGRAPLLVVNAGERPGPAWPDGGFSGAEGGGLLPVMIPLLGGAVRHAPWFHGRRSRLLAPADPGARPVKRTLPGGAGVLVRPAVPLADLLAALLRDAAAQPPAPRRATAARILLEPPLHGARVLAAGAWRDGARGALFAALHALHRLVHLARTLVPQTRPSAAGERS